MRYIQSPHCYIMRSRGKSFLYHSLKVKKIFGQKYVRVFKLFRNSLTRGEMLKIQKDYSKEVNFLIEEGFLVPQNEKWKYLNKVKKEKIKPNLISLYLFLTTNCNFTCKYCFVRPDIVKKMFMNEKVVDRAIQIFLRMGGNKKSLKKITFYGGEPLLNFKILQKTIHHLKILNETGVFSKNSLILELITNGSLIDRKLATYLFENNINVVISIDGKKNHHDKMRKYKSGKGTWKDVINGLKFLKKAGINPFISCTIGSHNIFQIKNIVEYFLVKLEAPFIGFNLLKGIDRKNPAYVPMKILSEKLLEAFDVFYDYGIYELRLMRKINNFKDGKIRLYECDAYGRQISVLPNGLVGTCHILLSNGGYTIGNIWDRNIVTKIEESLKRWCEHSPINMEACKRCKWQGICGGGCIYNVWNKTNPIKNLDKDSCILTKKMMRWALKKYNFI